MVAIVNTKVGVSRGKKRVWLEGRKLENHGLSPEIRFDLEKSEGALTLRVSENGRFKVSKRTRNNVVSPIIDLTCGEIAELFDGCELVRVLIKQDVIVISVHHSELLIKQREERLLERVKAGKPLRVGSLFHGMGALDLAVDTGLQKHGIGSKLSFAVEVEPKYLELSMRNNPIWSDDSIAIESRIEDVHLGRGTAPEIEVLIAGIPCTSSSRAGRSKNKNKLAEEHSSAGSLFFDFLSFCKTLNPSCILIENVPDFGQTAGMAVIRSVLGSMGFVLHETILEGNEYGALEARKRLCVVAVSRGLNTFDVADILPIKQKEHCIADILEDIPDDSERWKTFDYLVRKEESDRLAGKGFKRNLLTGNEPKCSTVGAGYAKCRSSESFVVHPSDSKLSRIFTAKEHCRVKGCPESLIEGVAETTAHQVLGNSVIFPAFVAVGRALAGSMLKAVAAKAKMELMYVEVLCSNDSTIGAEDVDLAPALFDQKTGSFSVLSEYDPVIWANNQQYQVSVVMMHGDDPSFMPIKHYDEKSKMGVLGSEIVGLCA